VGEDREENEGPFLPMRLFFAEGADDRRARHERARERQIAEHVSRRREHGGGPAARARGLSRADIVDKAVAIADADGTEAVSMRRIAKDLQVGVMSLYWYVDSKDELHQFMLETVQAEIEAADPSGDWRADLAAYARSTRAAVHRHPWAIDYIGAGPPSGPYDARNADQLIAALDGLGLDVTTMTWIGLTVGTYVMGATLREIQEMRWERAVDEAVSQMAEDDIAEAFAEFDRRVCGSGRYPHLAKVLDAGIDPDAPETREERFEFGLSCLLDGIAARIKELARSVTGTYPHHQRIRAPAGHLLVSRAERPAASVTVAATHRSRGPIRGTASACLAHSS
jgi:AcrR family transcriptional regulator